MNPASLRKLIFAKIPEGSVIPRHTDKEHLYEIVPCGGKIFKSVTTRLQILKDESLITYKMNRALDYIFANYPKFTDENIMEHLDVASKQSGFILEDAGDIGTAIHNYREAYFGDWIKNKKRPESVLSYIPEYQTDIRATSGMRALEKFVTENNYAPVACELKVWDEKFEVAGTLDDVGVMNGEMVLMDLKTSNQFKNHYFFQVALYYMMFRKLTELKPKRCFILKVSKDDGTYKIEELYNISKLVRYAKSMLRTNEGLDFIRTVRKDNQKKVMAI